MAAVVSVERLSTDLANGNLTADSAALSKSQTTANCVPFHTIRCTAEEATADRWASYCISSHFIFDDPDYKVRHTRVRDNSYNVLETTVVEFDGTNIEVQSFGPLSKTSVTDLTQAITTIDQTKAFIYMTYYADADTTDELPYRGMLRAYFSADDEVTISQDDYNVPLEIYLWVVEAQGTEFTVQPVAISLTGTTATDTITSVATDRTFLVGSYTADTSTLDDNNKLTIDVRLTNGTTVTADRHNSGGTVTYDGFAVTFGLGEGPSVQRGRLIGHTASPMPQDVNLTTALDDLDWAMVHSAGQGDRQNVAMPGEGSSDHADAYGAWSFVDSDTIRLQHLTDGGEADNDWSWEVIDWRFNGAAPSRRVMVVS